MIDLLPAPEPRDSAERCVLADVAKYGLHVVHVPPADGTPGWSFSIGLYRSYGSPEVVVSVEVRPANPPLHPRTVR